MLVEAEMGGRPATCTVDRLGFGELQPQINGGAHPLTPPINTIHIPINVREVKNGGLASYSAPKFILCRVERETRF
jgi:hypothetical protein